MNIILVSNKMAKAKSLSVMQAGMLLAALVLVPVLLTLLFITPQSNIKEQGVKALLPPHLKNSIISSQVHLDAYAKELGELQARMMRLDAQSERLAKIAGEKDKSSGKKSNQKTDRLLPANQGGPLINAHPMIEMSLVSGVGQPAAFAIVVLAENLRPRVSEAALRAQVQAELESLLANVNRALSDYERLHTLVIAREAWSIDNGLLTPTMKLKRARIEAAIADDVPRWYAKAGVQWH